MKAYLIWHNGRRRAAAAPYPVAGNGAAAGSFLNAGQIVPFTGPGDFENQAFDGIDNYFGTPPFAGNGARTDLVDVCCRRRWMGPTEVSKPPSLDYRGRLEQN